MLALLSMVDVAASPFFSESDRRLDCREAWGRVAAIIKPGASKDVLPATTSLKLSAVLKFDRNGTLFKRWSAAL